MAGEQSDLITFSFSLQLKGEEGTSWWCDDGRTLEGDTSHPSQSYGPDENQRMDTDSTDTLLQGRELEHKRQCCVQ